MQALSTLTAAISLFAAVGCGDGDKKASPKASGKTAAPSLPVYVDDRVVGSLSSVEARQPLAKLLPGDLADPRSWAHLHVIGAKGKRILVAKPGIKYPDHDFVLEPGDGVPAFRIRQRDNPALPAAQRAAIRGKVVGEVVDVVEVRVRRTTEKAVVAAGLTIVTSGTRRSVTPAELETIAQQKQPGARRNRARGWPLRAIIAKVAPKTEYQKVVLEGAKGIVKLELGREVVHGDTWVALLKRNRGGMMRFRAWDTSGDEPERKHEHPNVAIIRLR